MILHGIEYQRPTSLNMRIMADHVTYSFLAFMKSIFHFCLGCYCGGYSQNGRSNLSSFICSQPAANIRHSLICCGYWSYICRVYQIMIFVHLPQLLGNCMECILLGLSNVEYSHYPMSKIKIIPSFILMCYNYLETIMSALTFTEHPNLYQNEEQIKWNRALYNFVI